MNFFQTKPQVMNIQINYYDLQYTVIQKNDKAIVINNYEDKENGYNNYEDFNIPNHNISIKRRETKLK